MDTKIDKNNWCINLKETPEGELKELFKDWFNEYSNSDLEFLSKFWGIFNGKYYCSAYVFHDEITINQWYNEIYLSEQRSKSIEVVETTKDGLLVTKSDLQQLEERLTKLIEQKFGNTEQPQSVENSPTHPKPIWETHPDWESCRRVRRRYYRSISGEVYFDTHNRAGVLQCQPFTEAHAKRQVAEIKLMEIAEKWNEGVEIKDGSVYTVHYDVRAKKLTKWDCNIDYINKNVICFHNIEYRNKSIELHKELWEQYFMIDNQNK